ncbi:MAG: hypothetical protein D6729_00050 [Deltaproteobacteria bacterium]|nr:MAG: hypothetical protein D6729_00050 [Deltaproteobacteria bacterium]
MRFYVPFSGLAPARPLALALLLALLGGCREPVLTARPEEEANAALAVLAAAGFDAEKVPQGKAGFDVTVDAGDLERAVSVLAAAGLPRPEVPGLAELFAEPGLVPTGLEEHVRYHRALSGELTETLLGLPGVVDARVHIALPLPSGHLTREPPRPEKASVLLRSAPGATVSQADVQALVAGAVPALSPERVSVVVVPIGRPEPPPAPTASGAPAPGPRSDTPRLAVALGGGIVALCGLALSGLLLLRRRRGAGG